MKFKFLKMEGIIVALYFFLLILFHALCNVEKRFNLIALLCISPSFSLSYFYQCTNLNYFLHSAHGKWNNFKLTPKVFIKELKKHCISKEWKQNASLPMKFHTHLPNGCHWMLKHFKGHIYIPIFISCKENKCCFFIKNVIYLLLH